MARTPKIIPFLTYDDPTVAATWLCRAFGFELHFAVRNSCGDVVHAQLRLGTDLIMLGRTAGDPKGSSSTPSVCVALEEVDAHCASAAEAGAKVLAPPHDTPHGTREYTCLDLEGRVWTFSNYWGEPLASAA